MVLLNALLAVAPLAAWAGAVPGQSAERRQISPDKLHDKYDFIIAGGGTSGLTVADRLTAAFPKSKHVPVLLLRRSSRRLKKVQCHRGHA